MNYLYHTLKKLLNFVHILEHIIIVLLSHILVLNMIKIYVKEIRTYIHSEYKVKFIISLMNYCYQIIIHFIYNFIFMIQSIKLKIECVCQTK